MSVLTNQPLQLSSHLCPLTSTSTFSCNSFPFSLITSLSLAVESPTLKINILYIQNILDPHPLLVTLPLCCSLPTATRWASFQPPPVGFLTALLSWHLSESPEIPPWSLPGGISLPLLPLMSLTLSNLKAYFSLPSGPYSLMISSASPGGVPARTGPLTCGTH